MSRDMQPAIETAAESAHVIPYLLVDLAYDSGTVRVASVPFDVVHGGQTYSGVGRLGSISTVEEGPEIKSYGVTMQLSGIPATYFAEISEERFQGRTCRIWLGFMDTDHRPLAAEVQIFGGRMDVLNLVIGGTVTATLTAESRLIDWERARTRRFTDQDQQKAFPGDLGLQFVQATTDMEFVWGRG